MQFGILSGTQKELGFERNSNETAENIWLLGCSFRGLRRDGFFFFPFRVLVMRIGGIDFVRSGEGFSLRGCPEFWFVTRDGLSAARWMGYYLEVPGVDGLLRVRKRCYGGCMLTNVPVYGNVVFLPEDGSCDGRGRIFRRVSEVGEDGILIEDLWERWFLLTPDGRRREVIRGLGPDPSPMGSGTGLQPARLSFGSPSVH